MVIIIDIAQFPDSIKRLLWKWVWGKGKPYKDYNFKPWDCAFCMTWWSGLLCTIIMHNFSLLTVTYSLLMAYATPVINYVLHWVLDALNKLITVLYALIGE